MFYLDPDCTFDTVIEVCWFLLTVNYKWLWLVTFLILKSFESAWAVYRIVLLYMIKYTAYSYCLEDA